tara:strand:- start:69 stop:950 length:882 start_codon:yes stop_codon:yes gene_type:complete
MNLFSEIKRLLLGPVSSRRSIMGIFFAIFAVILLTAVTEIGGIILWFSYGIGEIITNRKQESHSLFIVWIFLFIYGISIVFVVPYVAPLFGRVPLNCFATEVHPYQANSVLYCALNRNYVQPKVKSTLEKLADHMANKFPGTVVSYLDANFPFVNGIPLLPHLSHNDGKKLDVAFFYKDQESGMPFSKGGGWMVGYWNFAPSWHYEKKQVCANDGSLRWKFAWLQSIFSNLALDLDRTSEMLNYLSLGNASKPIQKVFIEPYLVETLNVHSDKIKFAGCNAARHDDHIHFQLN